MQKINVGIVGASGYTGAELVRILSTHPNVDLVFISSENHSGNWFEEIHPSFAHLVRMQLVSLKEAQEIPTDVVFLALPHGVSMEVAPIFLVKGIKVIDLSGDFRLAEKDLYEKWYGKTHKHPSWLGKAVYGLPEIFKKEIQKATLVANPGCYVTSVLLAVLPLLVNKLMNTDALIIADSKSGVTGAGIKPSNLTHFPAHFGNFFAYKIGQHRHMPEIANTLSTVAEKDIKVLFTPHLLPVDRGILSTVYFELIKPINTDQLTAIYKDFYRASPFVRIVESAQIKNVRGSNYVDITPFYDENSGRCIVTSALDNLVKGASGQAVQNMNILFDLPEITGLNLHPLNP